MAKRISAKANALYARDARDGSAEGEALAQDDDLMADNEALDFGVLGIGRGTSARLHPSGHGPDADDSQAMFY